MLLLVILSILLISPITLTSLIRDVHVLMQVKMCSLPLLPRRKELYAELRPFHTALTGQSRMAEKHPVYKCNEEQVSSVLKWQVLISHAVRFWYMMIWRFLMSYALRHTVYTDKHSHIGRRDLLSHLVSYFMLNTLCFCLITCSSSSFTM